MRINNDEIWFRFVYVSFDWSTTYKYVDADESINRTGCVCVSILDWPIYMHIYDWTHHLCGLIRSIDNPKIQKHTHTHTNIVGKCNGNWCVWCIECAMRVTPNWVSVANYVANCVVVVIPCEYRLNGEKRNVDLRVLLRLVWVIR